MTRRILSIALALVATALGYAAAWTGGTTIAQYAQMGRPVQDVFAILLLVLGVALLAAGSLTIWLSSAGVIVVGSIHVVVGLGALLLAPTGLREGFAPVYQLLNALNGLSREISYGAYYAVPTGWGLLTGAALIVVGIAARQRRAAPTSTARILSIAAALIIGIPGVLLVLGGGGTAYRSIVATLQPPPVLALAAMLVGALVVAASVYPTRWSAAGAIALGAIVAVAGIVFMIAPGPVFSGFGPSNPLGMGVGSAGVTGNVLLAGVVIAAAGVGAKLRADRAQRASV